MDYLTQVQVYDVNIIQAQMIKGNLCFVLLEVNSLCKHDSRWGSQVGQLTTDSSYHVLHWLTARPYKTKQICR